MSFKIKKSNLYLIILSIFLILGVAGIATTAILLASRSISPTTNKAATECSTQSDAVNSATAKLSADQANLQIKNTQLNTDCGADSNGWTQLGYNACEVDSCVSNKSASATATCDALKATCDAQNAACVASEAQYASCMATSAATHSAAQTACLGDAACLAVEDANYAAAQAGCNANRSTSSCRDCNAEKTTCVASQTATSRTECISELSSCISGVVSSCQGKSSDVSALQASVAADQAAVAVAQGVLNSCQETSNSSISTTESTTSLTTVQVSTPQSTNIISSTSPQATIVATTSVETTTIIETNVPHQCNSLTSVGCGATATTTSTTTSTLLCKQVVGLDGSILNPGTCKSTQDTESICTGKYGSGSGIIDEGNVYHCTCVGQNIYYSVINRCIPADTTAQKLCDDTMHGVSTVVDYTLGNYNTLITHISCLPASDEACQYYFSGTVNGSAAKYDSTSKTCYIPVDASVTGAKLFSDPVNLQVITLSNGRKAVLLPQSLPSGSHTLNLYDINNNVLASQSVTVASQSVAVSSTVKVLPNTGVMEDLLLYSSITISLITIVSFFIIFINKKKKIIE